MLTSASSAHVGAKQLPRSVGNALLTGPPGYRFHIVQCPPALGGPAFNCRLSAEHQSHDNH
ncbi:unnamed protein product [Protopolystoma xenopodis]|uniref:Uncharacterized protein n=1 Tax=Protopolystoma xenopodis TaxID=117903 RepID=A0A3S5ASB8_9PLAT|nr:unnamed protein product [Protopolystoma xenopodis]